MNKMVLAVAGVLMAAPAFAADLPLRSSFPTPEPLLAAAPPPAWAGPYVGGQIGYGWTKSSSVVLAPPATPFSLSLDGARGGVHAGYNWQRGGLVYGLEADLEFANAADRLAKVINVLPPPTLILGSRMGVQGSLRLRLGYALDRALVYATGGLAVARIKESAAAPGAITSVNGAEYGYTVGGGLEYAFSRSLSARVEYRFSDYGKVGFDSVTPLVATSSKVRDNAVRVGMSYRFSSGAGPIYARY